MANDWIKVRTSLVRHPKVVRLASALKADSRPDKLRVMGALCAVWFLFDEHSEDGVLWGYTPDTIDHEIGWPGFCAQLVAVGWMSWDGGEGLSLPDFDTHNGASAKRRVQEADRKRAERASAKTPDDDRNASASDADKKRTREEKRREEKKEDSDPIGSGAVAPPTDRDMVFAIGVPLLTASGVSEKNARSMLAQLSKKHGEAAVHHAVTTTAANGAGEPVSYLQRILGNGGQRMNPQEALEASNREVARRWAERNGNAAA